MFAARSAERCFDYNYNKCGCVACAVFAAIMW